MDEPSVFASSYSNSCGRLVLDYESDPGGGGRVMSFGRSRARMSGEGQVHVNFSDVAGEDEAKEELAEVVDF